MKTIELSDKDFKLLISILKDCEDDRSNMGCNDPYKEEEKIFTKKERIEMAKDQMPDIDDEDNDGFLFNNQYVQYLIDKIKKQTRKQHGARRDSRRQ